MKDNNNVDISVFASLLSAALIIGIIILFVLIFR